ncbi:MAG: DUF4980 domain-containing protein [Paludibacteraceae bacterium]|nr:DUF4980 domain-containing protein [Paludibacteraceae bacterium]
MRFTPEAKYLLLPIQESATEGRMRVLIGQHEVDNFVIRLAVDSIDYYVPYAWPTDTGTVLLDMCFWDKEVDRTACVCWDSIYQSDEFDTTNREPMRPEYHHTPLYGWMNDPNGMFYDDQTGLWHLYFQYNPYGSLWQNMTWGHSTSPDLIHWTHHPEAIRPNALGTIFSGSCVVDRNNSAGFGENAVIAIYTNSEMCGQSQSIAYSLDGGMTFTPYEGNPVLADSLPDFRDPKVFWDEQANCWTMALACQQEIRFFQSPDLKNWTFVSRFGKGYGCHDGVWECPDLIRLDNHYVLLVNINPGGPFGGSATQYFVGDWDGKEFIVESQKSKEESKWLDYGKDHYATVTFHNAPDSRVTALAWVSNWEYANKLPMTQYRSQNSLPRELSLFQDDQGEYRVAVMPSPEALALKGNQIDAPTDECMIEITCPCENKKTVITLSNDKGEKVVMKLDLSKKTFSMDRKQSGDCSFSRDFAAVTTAPLFKMANANANANAVTLFIDHCVLEAFDGEGAWAMTNLVFPSAPYNHIHVVGGEATIYEIDRLR